MDLLRSRTGLAGAGVAALVVVVLLFVLLRGSGSGLGATPSPTATLGASASATASARESVTAATPSASDQPTVTPAATGSPTLAIGHVFVVVMENQDFTDIYGRSKAKYVTQLAEANAYANNYDAVEHPSLGNYLDMTGGTSAGTSGDCSPSDSCHVTSANIVDEFEASGITWKGYFESMGTPCRMTDTSGEEYEAHHNPFAYFDSIRTDLARCEAHTVDYSQLARDLASAGTTPNFSFVIPSGPTHNGSHSISGGDTWLSQNLPPILSSPACTQESCLVVLTWDEDNYEGRNQVLTVFAGSAARSGYVSSVAYNHYSLLRTFESIFSVAPLTENDAAASPMSDMLK